MAGLWVVVPMAYFVNQVRVRLSGGDIGCIPGTGAPLCDSGVGESGVVDMGCILGTGAPSFNGTSLEGMFLFSIMINLLMCK